MKENIIPIRILALSLMLLWPLAAPGGTADALIQLSDTGRIDWSDRTVRVKGVAAPTAVDASQTSGSPLDILDSARRMAQSNLLETVAAIRINAVSRVADRAAQSTAFCDGLATLARNAPLTSKEYLSDGTLEVELTMNLTGGFGQFVLPEEIRQVDSVVTMPPTGANADKPAKMIDGTDGGPHTGLILDATGIAAMPSLVPVVVDESGEVVYGPAFVSREFAVSQGMSGFATTLAAARTGNRVGDRPMVVKALTTHSTGNTNFVISKADAARIRSSVVHLNFLKECRVSIVMDPLQRVGN